MIELYTGNCRTFLSNYNGPAFDAVITDPPYSSGGATLSDRAVSTAEKYTNTKRNCPFPDFAGDQMDARSWLHMMADVFADARVRCHDGAILVAFCDWRQMPLLSDAVQWAGWMWRGTIVWDKLSSRPQRGRFRQQAEFAVWASNGKLAHRPACSGTAGRVSASQRAGCEAPAPDAEAARTDAQHLQNLYSGR